MRHSKHRFFGNFCTHVLATKKNKDDGLRATTAISIPGIPAEIISLTELGQKNRNRLTLKQEAVQRPSKGVS